MTTKEAGCLVCIAVTAVLGVGGAWISFSVGGPESVIADLIVAAKMGNATEIKSLLDHGADRNATEVFTADAPTGGIFSRIARVLGHRESNPTKGDSALTCAVNSLHRYDSASVLIQHGASAKTGLLFFSEEMVHPAV